MVQTIPACVLNLAKDASNIFLLLACFIYPKLTYLLKVAINGFGRIGRSAFKILMISSP